jgi:hypothetical protein
MEANLHEVTELVKDRHGLALPKYCLTTSLGGKVGKKTNIVPDVRSTRVLFVSQTS